MKYLFFLFLSSQALASTTDRAPTAGQFPGTSTNDNATPGNIGESFYSTVSRAGALALTTNVSKTITSIALTPGDWRITMIACETGAPTATQGYAASISTTTNTLSGANGDSQLQQSTISSANGDECASISSFRASISSNTTYYLVMNQTFSAGTASGYGRISARRER